MELSPGCFSTAFPVWVSGVFLSCLLLCGCAARRFGGPGGQDIERLLSKAEAAFCEDDYRLAARCYIDAIVKAEDMSLPAADLEYLRHRISAVYLDWSRYLYWEARGSRSVESCVMALEMAGKAADANPSIAPQIKKLCERLDKEIASIAYKRSVEFDIPDLKARNLKIASLCRQAAILTESGLLAAARDKYEEVLAVDPYNLDAARGLTSVSRKLRAAGAWRRKADIAQRSAEAEWSYVRELSEREAMSLHGDAGLSLCESLYACVLDEVDFHELPLDQALALIAMKVSAELDGKFSFEYKDFNPKDDRWPPVTFKTRDIPASEAIRVLCDAVGLDFNCLGQKVILSVRKQ